MFLIDLANCFHFRDEKNAQTEVSASNTDFSEMTLKLTQSTPGTFCELPGI